MELNVPTSHPCWGDLDLKISQLEAALGQKIVRYSCRDNLGNDYKRVIIPFAAERTQSAQKMLVLFLVMYGH